MMTNSCYCPRGVFDMYRGGDPVKLNLYRKRIRNRLFYRLFRGRMYWGALDVLHKIHEIYTIVSWKIHRTMRRIVRFAYKITYKSAMAILRLNAPIRVAFMVAFTALYGCALIALIN